MVDSFDYTTDEDKVRPYVTARELGKIELTEDVRQRHPEDGDQCPNCGELGDPDHHWMDEALLYICLRRPDMADDAPPPPGY